MGGDSRGELELSVDTRVKTSETKKNTFELVSGKAGLYAHGESAEQCAGWVAAIEGAVQTLKDRAAGGGGGGGACEMHTFAVSGSGAKFTIPKQYELIKSIGQGAYGIVISANDTEKAKNADGEYEKVAIKKITRAFEDLIDAKRILREIRLLKHFDHENIISIVSLVRPISQRFEDM